MLNEKEFNLLTGILYNKENNLGDDIRELEKAEYVKNGQVTKIGMDALEPYRVRRAIFLAAGTGNRLRPITINTPKPLVRVNGKRMIETLIDACQAAEIEEIIIVRGYLAEQFDVLKKKYPTIKFIDNDRFDSENNISSAILVKDMLENAYVLEADLVLNNPKLITPYQYKSNYLGVYTDKTLDWCFDTKDGRITKIKQFGENCHHMFGVSYWDKNDGQRLKKDLEKLYSSEGGKQKFWDFAALENNIDDYSIYIRECTFGDICEIDSFLELKQIDKAYDI